MSKKDLCWECKKEVERFTPGEIAPYLHCHHEPREGCVCELGVPIFYSGRQRPGTTKAEYCPKCGRKL